MLIPHFNRDKNTAANRLRASEVGWQSRLLGASGAGVRPSRLRCIAVSHIINENTTRYVFLKLCSPK